MARKGMSGMIRVMVLLGLGTGVLLGRGLELCFGIGQYRMIMLFGGLGGLGIALLVLIGRVALGNRQASSIRQVVVAEATSVLGSFLVYFFWRVLPLIHEEIRYGL